jgi:hypothetical protein
VLLLLHTVLLILIEYCVLSVLLYFSFGSEIKLNDICKSDANSHEGLEYSMGEFLKKVCLGFLESVLLLGLMYSDWLCSVLSCVVIMGVVMVVVDVVVVVVLMLMLIFIYLCVISDCALF